MNNFYKKLKEYGSVKLNKPIKSLTTFKIGGLAYFFIEVKEKERLCKLLDFLRLEGKEYLVVGGGSNLLLPDDDLDVVVIKIQMFSLPFFDDSKTLIQADAGTPLALVVNKASEQSLSGLEWAAGIPGTIGGAVRGNAGAFGESISDNLQSVEVYRDGEILELKKEECGFGYRESFFKHNNDVILSVKLKLNLGVKQDIIKKVQENISYRLGRFASLPSAGSFFKNLPIDAWTGDKKDIPEKFLQVGKLGVAWLIDQCGLKGYAIGGAKVSDEHANFVVNFNNATQADVLKVVEHVKQKVYNKYKIELEEEVQIISS